MDITVEVGVDRLADVDHTRLCGDKAYETRPTLGNKYDILMTRSSRLVSTRQIETAHTVLMGAMAS